MTSDPQPFLNLGGKKREPDARDHLIGSASAPIYTFAPTHAKPVLPYYFQGKRPACGAHAGTSLKVFLNRSDRTNPDENDTPRALWINIKRDGTSPSDGTDMATIFKTLQTYGAVSFEPLKNDVTYDDNDYAALKFLTQPMETQGSMNKIQSYAYLTDLSFNGIKQGIDSFGAVLLLINANAQMWTAPNGETSWAESDVLPLRPPTAEYPVIDGHFILATYYDEQYIYGPNSFGTTWGREGDFYFGSEYIPQILEAGIAHNAPLSTPITVTPPPVADTIQVLQAQKVSLLQQLIQVLTAKLNAALHPTGSIIPDMKPLILSTTFWFSVLKFVSGIALEYTAAFPGSHYVGIAVMIESAISLVLRLQTTTGIGSIFPKTAK